MSYEVLAAIVLINAAMTFSLWRQMATKVNRPSGLSRKDDSLWRRSNRASI
jgi:hypothetical protein